MENVRHAVSAELREVPTRDREVPIHELVVRVRRRGMCTPNTHLRMEIRRKDPEGVGRRFLRTRQSMVVLQPIMEVSINLKICRCLITYPEISETTLISQDVRRRQGGWLTQNTCIHH